MRLARSALIAFLTVAACAPAVSERVDARVADQPPPTVPAVLTVDNQRTEAAAIYLYHAGVKTQRLGTVESLSSATFILAERDGAPGSEFQLAAIAFANGWVDVSDPATVVQRAHYHWQLAPTRGQQFLSIRYAAADGTTSPRNGDRLPGNAPGNASPRGAQ